MDTIKLKRATKPVASVSTKVPEKDEVLVTIPNSGSGKGKCQLKFGDGVTATKSPPITIDGKNADEMRVSTIPTISDENSVLSTGETVKVSIGKIKEKFTYLENLLGNIRTVTNLFGSNDAKTVAQGLQNLVNTKLNKSGLYDGTDSTNKSLGATANALRKVNGKTDNNASSTSTLNSNLASIRTGTQLATLSMNNKSITGILFNGYKTIEIMVIIQQASNGNMFFNSTLVPLVSHILDGTRYITILDKSYGYCANVLLPVNYSADTVTLIKTDVNERFGLNAIYILGLK